MTLDDAERRFPDIPWRTPIAVTVQGQGTYRACRLCIAQFGLQGATVKDRAIADDV